MNTNGKVTNVVIAGLGGQGVISASNILCEAAFQTGFDVKKAEVHGMSQRGGSVTTDVRFGNTVLSPMVPRGEADYLIVMTPEEIDRARGELKEGGVMITPDNVEFFDLPSARSMNVALMAVLSKHLDTIPTDNWVHAIKSGLKEKLHDTNIALFETIRSA